MSKNNSSTSIYNDIIITTSDIFWRGRIVTSTFIVTIAWHVCDGKEFQSLNNEEHASKENEKRGIEV